MDKQQKIDTILFTARSRIEKAHNMQPDRMVRVEVSVETLTIMAYVAYAYGFSLHEITNPSRSRALRIASDCHNVVTKRDRDLDLYLHLEAERLSPSDHNRAKS